MELPKRKTNRLPEYDYNTAGAYFITICTKDRKCLLAEIVGDVAPDDPSLKAQKMEKAENPPIEVEFSDGMSRATSPTKAVVPRFVAALKRFSNKEIGENIFQRSYHDHIIRNEKDYLRIWEYIENNPKQWELDCFYVEDMECI